MQNSDIAKIFEKTADLLAIQDKNPFRVRAYQNAARLMRSLPHSVENMVEEDKDLTKYEGIGKDLAGKIKEIVETESLEQLEKLEKKSPGELADLVKLPGLGPKKVKKLYQKLKIKSLEDIEDAAKEGKIAKLDGFGKKTQKKILDKVKKFQKQKKEGRIIIAEAENIANDLISYLKKSKQIKKIEIAGSYRRRKETVGDLDILVTGSDSSKIMKYFTNYKEIKKVESKGETKSTVRLKSDFQVDLRLVKEASFGAALYYFTGSKAHNIEMRKKALKKDYKINEYGIYDKSNNNKKIAGKTEKSIFKVMDLPFIEPELRQNRGEFEAAKENQLPKLIELKDIKGNLHTHTKATDGKNSLKEMIKEAKKIGYEYYAVTDHSKKVKVADGLNKKELEKQIEEIEKLNKKVKDIRILKSIEVDILESGKLDLPNEILKELDLVVCSIHYKRNLSKKSMTKRITKAMENPYFNIFAHPTGRLIHKREAYPFDIDEILKAAKENQCALEINAQPDRQDLRDIHCQLAKEKGLKMVISSDAHSTQELHNIKYGVYQARRGWLEKEDVLNTLSLKKFLKAIKKS